MRVRLFASALAASVALSCGAANAVELEVTHWWTSGGEAAAVAEMGDGMIATCSRVMRTMPVARAFATQKASRRQIRHAWRGWLRG